VPDPVHQTERRCLVRDVNTVLGRAEHAGQTGAKSVPPHRRCHRHHPGARQAIELQRAAAGDDVPGLGPPSVDRPHDLDRNVRARTVSDTEVVTAVTAAVVVVDHRPPEVGGDDLPRPLLRPSRRHPCSVPRTRMREGVAAPLQTRQQRTGVRRSAIATRSFGRAAVRHWTWRQRPRSGGLAPTAGQRPRRRRPEGGAQQRPADTAMWQLCGQCRRRCRSGAHGVRQAKIMQIFEGTNQIQRLVISRELARRVDQLNPAGACGR